MILEMVPFNQTEFDGEDLWRQPSWYWYLVLKRRDGSALALFMQTSELALSNLTLTNQILGLGVGFSLSCTRFAYGADASSRTL
jgi:hypothetical protein